MKGNYIGICLLIGFIMFSHNFACSQQAPYGNPGEQTAVTKDITDLSFGYYEYLPTDFSINSGRTFPLVLFYHGLGEKGDGITDLSKVLKNGPPKMIENGTDFDAIVISPQSSGGWFSPDNFLTIYNYLISKYPIDTNRVYVTGLSAGGGSTWNALKADHTKIAAAIPICGAGALENPSEFLQKTPIWAHHNFEDTVVRRGQTINNMNRIANVSTSVMEAYPSENSNTVADQDYTMQFDTSSKSWASSPGINSPDDKLAFTLYKNGGHNAWTKTYNNPDVWDWLFAQRLDNQLSTNHYSPGKSTIYYDSESKTVHIDNVESSKRSLEIYDMRGIKIYDQKIDKNSTINMASFGSGTFIIKIFKSTQKIEHFKIIAF